MSVIGIDGIDFEKSNVTFVNGLTLEMVKMKYNWLLNAKVKDAIVGENDRGIVWYFGDWYCGEWLDGTWYSGNFYDGIWKNGLFYSYKLEKFDVLNEKFFIKQTGNQYSIFHNGYWLSGTFYSGQFGLNSGETWTDYELYYTTDNYPNFRIISSVFGGSIQYLEKKLATWIDGTFQNGEVYDSIWNTGQHVDGLMKNSKWLNGNWYNGTFNGETWYNGYWYNGEFIKGDWMDGTFNKLKSNIISRFGSTLLNTTNNEAICNWHNGTWENGDFFSGYVTGSTGEILDSEYNYLSIWHNGNWNNGTWYGGHFKLGTWKNGTWRNGVFGYLNSTEWTTPNKVYQGQDFEFLGTYWSGTTVTPQQTNGWFDVSTVNTDSEIYEYKYYLNNDFNELNMMTASTSIYSLSGVSIKKVNNTWVGITLKDNVFKVGDSISFRGFVSPYTSIDTTVLTITTSLGVDGKQNYTIQTDTPWQTTSTFETGGYVYSVSACTILINQDIITTFDDRKLGYWDNEEVSVRNYIDISNILDYTDVVSIRIRYNLKTNTSDILDDTYRVGSVNNLLYEDSYSTRRVMMGFYPTYPIYPEQNSAKTNYSYLTLSGASFNNNRIFDYANVSSIISFNVNYKMKTSFENGGGTNQTYWRYHKTQLSNNGYTHYIIDDIAECWNRISVNSYQKCVSVSINDVKEDIQFVPGFTPEGGQVQDNQILNFMWKKCYIVGNPIVKDGYYTITNAYAPDILYPKNIRIDINAKYLQRADGETYSHRKTGYIFLETDNRSFVSFIGVNKPDLKIGDYIKVKRELEGVVFDSYDSWKWNHYDENRMISDIGNTVDGNYYIKIDTDFNTNVNVNTPGKIIKLLGEFGQFSRWDRQIGGLYFFDFDFNIGELNDEAKTFVNGYSVKYDLKSDWDGQMGPTYRFGGLALPVKNLSLNSVTTDLDFTYAEGWDNNYYNYVLYQTNNSLPKITGSKEKSTQIGETTKTYYYGGSDDLWGLKGLEEYYPVTENKNPDNYNVTLLPTALSQMRISPAFVLNDTFSQKLYISNVKFKFYYSNEVEKPIWENGTWQKGIWYNGDFYNGDFLSGMWIKGNFYNGNMSSNYR